MNILHKRVQFILSGKTSLDINEIQIETLYSTKSKQNKIVTKIYSHLHPHQVPLFRVSGIVEGHWSLRTTEHSLLGVPQDMRVGCQNIPRMDTLPPQVSTRFRRTQQIVAFQLSNLALVLQTSLLCYLELREYEWWNTNYASKILLKLGLLCVSFPKLTTN